MTMFTICTAYIENGKIEKRIEEFAESEKKFTKDIGVISRKFFQCKIQPHLIWSFTEWNSEKDHNNAAQSIMQTRRDDRFASIAFGPEPYFEILFNLIPRDVNLFLLISVHVYQKDTDESIPTF